MKRREMLKGLGLSIGALAITPTVASLLQSCTADEKITWIPQFFSEDQLPLLHKFTDVILPKTENAPSATAVNVPQFIDRFVAEVFEPEGKELLKSGFKSFSELFSQGETPTDFNKVEVEAIENQISKLLTKSKEEHEDLMKTLNEAIENETEIPKAVMNYATVDTLRNMCVFGYKSSEYIGEQVLAYKPVPGQQQGCVDVQEATGGKAYAL